MRRFFPIVAVVALPLALTFCRDKNFTNVVAIANGAVSTVLVGYSTLDQLETAARSVNKGPLSRAALERLAELQRGFVGEQR